MNATQWSGLIVSFISIFASFVLLIRWLVKHYLAELRPNGGSSIKDTVTRLEERVEILYQLVLKGKND